jgi:hypothetical protein
MARELHRVIAADQPYTFLYVPKATTVLDRKLVRVVADGAGPPRYAAIVPDRVGQVRYHFTQWIKTPQPMALDFTPR